MYIVGTLYVPGTEFSAYCIIYVYTYVNEVFYIYVDISPAFFHLALYHNFSK